ncbi:hypothetical protein MKEN_00459600 [Mycena kentingensis (nom. inval.)]|nr:hypothetical protein MKEN_00459600 [Mycena kentingensis (nom. inval.)]
MSSFLGEEVSASPDNSDSEDSDSTLEDLDMAPVWAQGYPLQRVEGRRNSNASTSSSASTNSDVVYDLDFDQLIDDLLAEQPFPMSETRNTVRIFAPRAYVAQNIRRLSSLRLLRKPTTRCSSNAFTDPPPSSSSSSASTNRSCATTHGILPHISSAPYLATNMSFLCMQRLVEFNQPPLRTVVNYVDFFRQVLEVRNQLLKARSHSSPKGLTFLHEHSIASLNCRDLNTYMVDLGPATACASASSRSASVESFDRTRYPVRYYFAELPSASELENRRGVAAVDACRRDVQDCALMMRQLASKVPTLSRKLGTLINAMQTGTFDADASRKLFEALCKALPADVFATEVPPAAASVTEDDHDASGRLGVLAIGMVAATSEPDLRLGADASAGRGLLRTVSLTRRPNPNPNPNPGTRMRLAGKKSRSNMHSPRARSPDPAPGPADNSGVFKSTLPVTGLAKVRARSAEIGAVAMDRRM